jgi:hypothetical protein
MWRVLKKMIPPFKKELVPCMTREGRGGFKNPSLSPFPKELAPGLNRGRDFLMDLISSLMWERFYSQQVTGLDTELRGKVTNLPSL